MRLSQNAVAVRLWESTGEWMLAGKTRDGTRHYAVSDPA